jgi:voltage-gated potassium channel
VAGAPRRPPRARPVSVRHLAFAVSAFAALIAVGTVGYRLVIGDSWMASFYEAVNALSTTGSGTFPASTGGRLLTIFLILSGVVTVFYAIGIVIELVVGGVVSGIWEARRMERRIERMADHHIVCGYGRVGRRVADELLAAGHEVVVVDQNPDALDRARETRVPLVVGDAAEDEVLREAGVERARSLVACSDNDAANTFIILTAKGIRPDLSVVARASTEAAGPKLERAGADLVVSPYSSAARQIANAVVRPQVSAYLTAAAGSHEPAFAIEEIEVAGGSPAAGRTIADIEVRSRTGALVLAIQKAGGSFRAHPPPDVRIDAGDVVIGVGLEDQIHALEQLLAPDRSRQTS